MSVLTINKLIDSVGAEVLGVDSDRLASDEALGAAVLDALEANGVLVFPGLGLKPEAQVEFCRRLGEVDHSSDGHHPVAGIYPITLDKSKNASAAYLRATFDWHIDGCTPIEDTFPQMATVLSAVHVADRGGETEFANSYAAYDAWSDEEKERYGSLRVVHSLEASQRRVTPNPSPEVLARWRARPHPRAPTGVDTSQRPSVAGTRSVRRLRRRHGSRRGQGTASGIARSGHHRGAGVQPPLVGRRHRHLGQPGRPASGCAIRPGLTTRNAAHDGARRRAHPVIAREC